MCDFCLSTLPKQFNLLTTITSFRFENNQVVFSNQNQQTNTNQNQDESQYLNENQQALDKISQTNFNNSPYLFKNQGRVDPTKIYGQQVWGQMVAIR